MSNVRHQLGAEELIELGRPLSLKTLNQRPYFSNRSKVQLGRQEIMEIRKISKQLSQVTVVPPANTGNEWLTVGLPVAGATLLVLWLAT